MSTAPLLNLSCVQICEQAKRLSIVFTPRDTPKQRKVAQAAFSFCTFHSSLFTLHFSLNLLPRLFQRRDNREERKEKEAFRPLVEKHFYFIV